MRNLKKQVIRFLSVTALIFLIFASPAAAGEKRELIFYQTHTGERLTVIYKINGDYVPEALKKIDHIMRDHRKNKEHAIDPKLLDYLYDLLSAVNNHGEVHIISCYRSPETNQMLRSHGGGGVAKGSLHMQGKALDFRLPGTNTNTLRDAALSMKRGGVGYYPDLDFIQIDTGRVRFW